MPQNQTLFGVLLIAFAASFVAVDTIIIRMVSDEVHPFEIAFFRNIFSLIVVAPWLLRSGLSGLKTSRLPIHIARALLKLAAMICLFTAIKMLPLAAVTAIVFTAPLFVTAGSMAFLGEPRYRGRLIALLVGFIGVLIVIRPGADIFDVNVGYAVLAAVGLGGVGLLMKYLSVREHPPSVVSLNLLLTAPVAFVLMLPAWTLPSPSIMALLVAQGLLGGLSQLCVARAMSIADASVLAPIEFLKLPVVVILAWLIFGETSDWWTLAGGTVIFASTFAIVVRERFAST